MSNTGSYGQYCPLALAAEFVCTRWSALVLRELNFGASSFNDISKGVPRMSRSLLSTRLKEFISRGIIVKETTQSQYDQYKLTKAGEALCVVIKDLAKWSQEWLQVEPSLLDIDSDHLMWNIRRSAKCHPDLPSHFVVNFYMPEQKAKFQNTWLVFDGNEIDLCIKDNDFEIDVQIEASVTTLTKVYMGWQEFDQALASKDLVLRGPANYLKLTQKWMGRSVLAEIERQPSSLCAKY